MRAQRKGAGDRGILTRRIVSGSLIGASLGLSPRHDTRVSCVAPKGGIAMSENGEWEETAARIMRSMTLDPDACYRALVAHDARFDGRFFVGVSSTRIYCRPVCSVRMPRRENCHFFPSAAAAEVEGYRPCLRCRPE